MGSGDACVIWVSVAHVINAVTIVVVVEVILDAIVVEIARPLELVNSGVVIVVFIIAAWSCAIRIFIGHAIVVVVHWVLIGEVESANWLPSPRVDDVLIEAAVG